MKITEETIDQISRLANLEFSGDDKVAIQQDMENIIVFMDKLQELDTEGVEPLIFMTDEVNRLRDDVAVKSLTQEEVLKNAPKKDSDYFRIPKVLSQGE